MKWDTVQLMVYGENLSGVEAKTSDPKLKILNVQPSENNSYLFVDIFIPSTLNPGIYDLIFYNDEIEKEFSYSIFPREIPANEHKGFSNEDVIYLIFADRFCDGNISNNTIGDSLDHYTAQILMEEKAVISKESFQSSIT